ncbi:MFS transporter [Nonomuraea glycinis]|uniref:MFS transporter n=1 Tax=Nonomuraea glycinis TaxID=2047744 RepID=UPI001667A67E|nr:MFS transporter [Nonomuraea glycinis]MCA2174742.1 MFS transporter [Nonomuraea glycinis]WSG68240.1 MFS transporter [Nonomuraea glycinis]
MTSSRIAVAVSFVVNGALYGSWAARVPALADQVGAGVDGVGLALLGPAVAMVLTTSPAARACAHWGPRRVLVTCLTAACLLLPVLGLADSVWTLGLALALLGGLMGAVDVSMNIAAVAVVRRLDRPLMPVFHAGFSFGVLGGSLGAAGAAALSSPPMAQFTVVGVAALATVAVTARAIPDNHAPGEDRPAGGFLQVMSRGRLWLLAGVALCAAVAEGACAEWSALFLVTERSAGDAAAAAAHSGFAVAIAVTRLTGERAQRRFGPYRLLMLSGILAAAGLFLAAVVPSAVAGYAGFAIAGIGLAFCFPLAMDLAGAAGNEPGGTGGDRELGFVTTVAYAGLLAGPPMIGGVATLADLTVAMGLVGVIALLIVPVTVAARPRW